VHPGDAARPPRSRRRSVHAASETVVGRPLKRPLRVCYRILPAGSASSRRRRRWPAACWCTARRTCRPRSSCSPPRHCARPRPWRSPRPRTCTASRAAHHGAAAAHGDLTRQRVLAMHVYSVLAATPSYCPPCIVHTPPGSSDRRFRVRRPTPGAPVRRTDQRGLSWPQLVDSFQERLAHVDLAALADYGFALAGGYACRLTVCSSGPPRTSTCSARWRPSRRFQRRSAPP
jgi:hypothetical protein